MNNDFNYRPRNNNPSNNPDSSEKPQTGSEDDRQAGEEFAKGLEERLQAEDFHADEAPRNGQVILPQQPRFSKTKSFLSFFAIFLLVAAVAGGVYIWQKTEADGLASSKANLEAEVASLQERLKSNPAADDKPAATAAPVPVTSIVTGSLVTNSATTPTVSMLYLPGQVQEIWVEVGTKPDSTTLSTKHMTEGLGAGTAGQYGEQQFGLVDLKPATKYFYRAAAKVNGQMVYGGVAAFTTLK